MQPIKQINQLFSTYLTHFDFRLKSYPSSPAPQHSQTKSHPLANQEPQHSPYSKDGTLVHTLEQSQKKTRYSLSAIRGDHLLIASLFASNTFESSLANRALSFCNEVYSVVVEDLAWLAFRTHDVSAGSHKSDFELIIGVRDACYV